MDSNQKPLPSPPPPWMPPPPPPKNGNTRGHPPLISTKLHDEGDGSAVGVGDKEAVTLSRSGRHELSRSGHHELSESGCRLKGEASSRSLVDCPGFPRRYSRVVARLGLDELATVAAVDDEPYACAHCSMTFSRETALCGHMRSHKRGHLSSDSEEDACTPKRRRKKRKSKLRTVTPVETTWGNHGRRNGTPRDAPAEVKVPGSDISKIAIDDDVNNTNPVIVVTGSHGAPSLALDVAATLSMAPAPVMAVPAPTPAPHAAAASVNTTGAPVAISTVDVTIPPAAAPRSAILTLPASMAPVHQPRQGTMAVASNLVPGNTIASSSCPPRPSMADPSQSIAINNFAAIDAPSNTMGRHLPFCLAGRRDTQALPVSPVHHPTQGMAMDGNPLTGHFPAAISSTGWPFPSIPLQNQEVNSNVAAIDAPANTMPRLPFLLTDRSAIHVPPVLMPVHQPTQGITAMAGNPMTSHFPAAMAGDWFSFPASISSVLPAIPLQTQEENPAQGRVVPANELVDPSQNQADNPPEQTVPSNNGGRTIRLFGKNIAEGQKEVKD